MPMDAFLAKDSMFADEDLPVRPHPSDTRGRSVHEHMVHQCVSEDFWFRTMLDVDVGAPPLPKDESRLGFMRRYADDSGKRLAALREKGETWWEGQTTFFDVSRSRAWVLTRRIAHTPIIEANNWPSSACSPMTGTAITVPLRTRVA
jgi:hypothetical protein